MGKSIQPPSVDSRFDNFEKCCGDDLEDERLSGNQRPCYDGVNQLILVEELVQPLRKEAQHKEEIRDNQCRKNRQLGYESLERRFALFLLRLSFFLTSSIAKAFRECQPVFLIAHSFVRWHD